MNLVSLLKFLFLYLFFQLALSLCEAGYMKEPIGDELFCQLIKQLSGNEKYDSIRRGWELLAIFLTFFIPRNEDVLKTLTAFIELNSDRSSDSSEVFCNFICVFFLFFFAVLLF